MAGTRAAPGCTSGRLENIHNLFRHNFGHQHEIVTSGWTSLIPTHQQAATSSSHLLSRYRISLSPHHTYHKLDIVPVESEFHLDSRNTISNHMSVGPIRSKISLRGLLSAHLLNNGILANLLVAGNPTLRSCKHLCYFGNEVVCHWRQSHERNWGPTQC